MAVSFVQNAGRREACGLTPELTEEVVEIGVLGGAGGKDAVALAEGVRGLQERPEGGGDGNGVAAEVAEVEAEKGAAVLVVGVLAEVAGTICVVGVQRGAAGVGEGAEIAVKLVDAVRPGAEAAAWGVVVAGVDRLSHDRGVDDGVERIVLAKGEGAAGDAEDAIAGLGGAADGGLADGKAEEWGLAGADGRGAGGAAAIAGELIDEGFWGGHGRAIGW